MHYDTSTDTAGAPAKLACSHPLAGFLPGLPDTPPNIFRLFCPACGFSWEEK